MEKYVPAKFWEDRYETFDLTRSGHRDLPIEYNVWLYRRKQDAIRKAISRHRLLPASADVLELGCGTGVYVEMWKKLGARSLAGFDISSVPIVKLKETYPQYRFYQEDLTDPTMAERHDAGAYGAVTAFDVLYHIIDDALFQDALGNINRLCRPGGLFFITDLFVHGEEAVKGYMKFRSLDRFTAALKLAGFEVLDRRPVLFSMIQAVDGDGLLRRLHDLAWSKVSPFIRSRPDFMGRLLYILDTMVTPLLREGPALEILVCRKTGPAAPGAAA